MSGPLDGIRILDFTTLMAGATATGFLCDLGADVVKVEPPGGEVGRRLTVLPSGLSTFFLPSNRGKRSVVLDLHTAAGREAAMRLAQRCDALTHNFRPGVMERLGLAYDDVRKVNPTIVYGETSGFGAVGPDAGLPSVDILGQARGGLMSITGGDYPTPSGAILSDYLTAMHFAIGILGALLSRERNGQGQKVAGSMLGSMVAAQIWEFTHYLISGQAPPRNGRTHHLLSHTLWGVYDTLDGHLALTGVLPAKLPEMAEALGCPGLADPRFADLASRAQHIDELRALVARLFAKLTTRDLHATLTALDIRCAPVQDYESLARDPQVLANRYTIEFEHPREGRVRTVANPLSFSETSLVLAGAEPLLGEHSEEVLAEAGFTSEERAAILGHQPSARS